MSNLNLSLVKLMLGWVVTIHSSNATVDTMVNAMVTAVMNVVVNATINVMMW